MGNYNNSNNYRSCFLVWWRKRYFKKWFNKDWGNFAINWRPCFFGEEIKKGVDIAVSEYKDKGIDINVIYEDDQSLSPTIAVNAANKLLNIDKIDVGLTLLVEESRPIAPIFNKKKFHYWFFGIVIILFKNQAIIFLVMVFLLKLLENQWPILLIIS